MSVGLQNLREVCDDQLDMVMKIERFRKAILEDIDNLIPYNDPMYRPVYPTANTYALYSSANNKNVAIQPQISGTNNYAYNMQQMFYQQNINPYTLQNQRQVGVKNQMQVQQKNARGGSGAIGYQTKNNGYQLKVGGVVVGSWATNRSQAAGRVNQRPGMVCDSLFYVFHILINVYRV